jgi:hypothetical protein
LSILGPSRDLDATTTRSDDSQRLYGRAARKVGALCRSFSKSLGKKFFTTYRTGRIRAETSSDQVGRPAQESAGKKGCQFIMSIVEIEVRGTSTMGFEDALLDAKRNADTCGRYVDLDEVSRFVDIDGGDRRFGVTLKVTCLHKVK